MILSSAYYMGYKYSICVINYNMSSTIEKSIRSIYDLTDKRFEILVIDKNSTDGSTEILQSLSYNHERIRFISDDFSGRGDQRRSAIDYAAGDYILHQLDADDEYLCCIIDFVEVFHQIENQVNFDPFLSGQHIHICHRSVLNRTNYLPLGYNNDREFWRRLIATGNYIGLLHSNIKKSIDYNRESYVKHGKVRFQAMVTQFRSGIKLHSYMRWLLMKWLTWSLYSDRSLSALLFRTVLAFPAYIKAYSEGIYSETPGTRDMREAERLFKSHIYTMSGIEESFSISIDRSNLTPTGRNILDIDQDDRNPPRYYLNEPLAITEFE